MKSPFKLFKPCKKILHLFKFRLHRKISIKALRFRKPKTNITSHKGRFPKLASIFGSLRRPRREMDQVSEPKSFSHHRAPCSSPITPAYIRTVGDNRNEANKHEDDDVEDACRSFEKYLMEMIIEEGKTKDLVDVEELLYCWKKLTCPVFTNLVCRFYGELCKDLFSSSTDKNPTEV